ncbi:flagellar biosynthetic protein FliR [Salipiger sp. P9]|uniref:flagellar biosynthetic protein FliR n=1 Tax=Salipiger pentaromativorans TaxID=2943193 RepID=UPI0021574357|nr:flagellar biosynthetic protein FliR [Salipiger pentaromativorans]MCR8550557.1 flagellar biosynthetic protein FliR [Salipiger pentaromativorans]
MNLSALLTVEFLGVAMVFARIGGVLMYMPALGESFIPMRHRLAFAVLLSLALYPALPVGPLALDAPGPMIAAFGIELTLGLWIGMTARILMSGLQFAGYQIGLIAGLSNAFSPDLGSFQGSTLISTGLMLGAVAVIFATDLHHLIIGAMVMSYDMFPPGQILTGDLAQQIVKAVGQSFYLGLSVAAPFYVMGLLMNLGMGLAARMMPSLPVFFVAAPVLILAGLLVLGIAAPMMMREFAERFADWLGLLVF